jgi:hypothetical protein
MKEFKAFLGHGGFLAFSIIFLILGILSLAWLIMYQEADPDRNFRGALARSVSTAVFWGFSIFFFLTWTGFVG